jgi:hypothetical protein
MDSALVIEASTKIDASTKDAWLAFAMDYSVYLNDRIILKSKEHKQKTELIGTLNALMDVVTNGSDSSPLEKEEGRQHTAYMQTVDEINALIAPTPPTRALGSE